jgi:Spy/CpxP family protein refolding chaperone
MMALVAAALVSSVSFAGAQAPTPNATGERHATGRGMEGRPGRNGLFRGVNLSDAEKAKIKQVREKYQGEAKGLRESLKPAMQEARAARQKGDSVAAKAAWDRSAADRDKLRALMERERADIRASLSSENQKQFDANVQQLAQRRAAKGEKTGKKGHGEHGARRRG